jgi:hypothetical protein
MAALAAKPRLRHVRVMSDRSKLPEPAVQATPEGPLPAKRPLSPAAERALTEAAARRAERERHPPEQPKEVGGRGGPEPTRYGDWEINGLASDF